MLNTVYWIFLATIALLLAYAGLFSIIPLIFLLGSVVLGLSYVSFLSYRRKRSGEWEHRKHQFRFVGSVFVYIVLYWTTVGMFTNVRELREFSASYEPYIAAGVRSGYTFRYIGHAGSYEHIDSPDLTRYLEESKPERVRLVLETVKDFGRLRAYSVAFVDEIPVNEAWIGGTPPWEELRSEAP